jgi:hypothetical protein
MIWISLLLVLPLVQAASFSSKPRAVENSKIVILEPPCKFFAPLANYTEAGIRIKSGEKWNLPLKKESGQKLNLTINSGNQFSYNLKGKEHQYHLKAMDNEEKRFICDCLTKLTLGQREKTFVAKQSERICTNVLCSNSTIDMMLKQEILDRLKNEHLIEHENFILAEYYVKKIINKFEYEYFMKVKEGTENYDEDRLNLYQDFIIQRLKTDLELTEKVVTLSCNMSKKLGKFLEI